MAENSKIEWTDHTFNPWIGCQKVSAACDNCYAETLMDTRYGRVEWGPHGKRVRTAPTNWRKPLAWARAARGGRKRPRVFCASLADVFDNKAPAGARAELFELIRQTPELDWLLLTKRPQNIARMLPKDWGGGYANVWLGTSAEDQDWYARRYRFLAEVPARIRFISYEPALGPLRPDWLPSPSTPRPDWIICGGESGARPRELDPGWARTLRDVCRMTDTAFFMKQMTGKKPIPADLLIRQFPTGRLQKAA